VAVTGDFEVSSMALLGAEAIAQREDYTISPPTPTARALSFFPALIAYFRLLTHSWMLTTRCISLRRQLAHEMANELVFELQGCLPASQG